MDQIFRYFLLIFLLSLGTIWAEYDTSPNSCAFAGLDRKSCYGSGTSSIADLLGYIFQGKTQYLIVGSCEGISLIWGMFYKWQPGAQAVSRSETLYAYCIDIPATNYTEHTYLVIAVADCPAAFELKKYTEGVIPGTDLPWKSVYEVVSEYCNAKYPADCELVQGSSTVYTDTSQLAYSVRLTVSVPCDGLTSFQYRPLCGQKNDEYPKKVVKKYNLDVDQGISDSSLYVQRGTPNGNDYSCTDPSPQLAIGRQLANEKYDVKSVYKLGGLCTLAKRLARIFASTPSGVYFGYAIFTFLQKPYKYAYQFSSWYSHIADYGVYQPLFSVC